MSYTEVTPSYNRISGTDIAGDPKAAIQEIVERFRDFDISPFMLKELDTFEQVFVATMILKLQLLVDKQKDYKSGNIVVLGVPGILKRLGEKQQRAFSLVGNPDEQVAEAKKVMANLPTDAAPEEERRALLRLDKILNPSNAVQDERVDDTLMDAGNYGDIAYVVWHGAWGKPLEENL